MSEHRGGYNFQNERTLKYQVPVLDSITQLKSTPPKA